MKILILGYKQKGRGLPYYKDNNQMILDNIAWLESGIAEIADKFLIVSFDNLAITQLNMRDKFSDEDWEMFYAGDDGTVTFYIDLVSGTFARSSLSNIHYPIGNKSIDEMFQIVREEVVNGSKELP